jgi:type I restriction enzyme S subunit
MRGLEGRYITETVDKTTQAGIDNSSARLLPAGTVAFCRTASVGDVVILGRDMATSQDFANWVCGPAILPEYLYEALRSSGSEFDREKQGSTHKTIYMPVLERFRVLLPPLAEQRRIADLLDKADTLRRKRQEAIALTDDLLRSTFLEMFGDLSQWPTRPFAELVSESLLGLVRAAAEQGPDRAHPYVRMNAIRPDGALDLTNLTRVDASAAEAERYRLYAGDFLFNTRNSRELVGKSAVYHPDGDEPIVFNNNILRIRFSPDVLPDFVSSYWQTAMATRELEKRKAGTTSVFAIYFKNLATLPVPVPPLSIQRAYTRACEASRTLQREYRSHAAASATLTSRLQRDAFER